MRHMPFTMMGGHILDILLHWRIVAIQSHISLCQTIIASSTEAELFAVYTAIPDLRLITGILSELNQAFKVKIFQDKL